MLALLQEREGVPDRLFPPGRIIPGQGQEHDLPTRMDLPVPPNDRLDHFIKLNIGGATDYILNCFHCYTFLNNSYKLTSITVKLLLHISIKYQQLQPILVKNAEVFIWNRKSGETEIWETI